MSPGVTAQKTTFRVFIRRDCLLKNLFLLKLDRVLLGASVCCNESIISFEGVNRNNGFWY